MVISKIPGILLLNRKINCAVVLKWHLLLNTTFMHNGILLDKYWNSQNTCLVKSFNVKNSTETGKKSINLKNQLRQPSTQWEDSITYLTSSFVFWVRGIILCKTHKSRTTTTTTTTTTKTTTMVEKIFFPRVGMHVYMILPQWVA